MKNSCGAVLFCFVNHKIHIILGKEYQDYFHFKGTCTKSETLEQAAIREVYEETLGIVNVSRLPLLCTHVQTKKKKYHLGLICVQPSFVSQFTSKRKRVLNNSLSQFSDKRFLEKQHVALFPLHDLPFMRYVTQEPINFFSSFLMSVQESIDLARESSRTQLESSRVFEECPDILPT